MSTPEGSPSGASRAPQIIVQQSTPALGWLGKVLLVALVVCVMVIIGMASAYQSYFSSPNGPQERYHSLSADATKKIAIITVSGPILDGDNFVKEQIDRVRDDKDVVAVVLRIDSPGGTITGSDYLYHHLKKLADERELPMVVSMGSICASGGYYIAMVVGDRPDSIFAEPTTWTGSIGVVIPHFDVSGLMDSWNIKDDSIASHPLKLMGSPTRPMTERERAILQQLVDQSFADFKAIVLEGRPKFQEDPDKLDELATGRIFTAKQALENGLVDKIGFSEEAVARAAELAGVGTSEVRCIQYEQPSTLFDSLMGAEAHYRGPNLATILDWTTPRAYYLWTWLPAHLTNNSP
jgi:protease-4